MKTRRRWSQAGTIAALAALAAICAGAAAEAGGRAAVGAVNNAPVSVVLHQAPAASVDQVVAAPAGWLTSGTRAMAEIVIPFRSSPAEEYAARELREHIHLATGVSLPIRPEGRRVVGMALSVGRTEALRAANVAPAMLFSGPEDFIVRRAGRMIYLVGGEDRGTLYAVYSFLENEVGVRWYAPGAAGVYAPRLRSLFVGDADRRESPALRARGMRFESYPGQSFEQRHLLHVWAVRNRLNAWDAQCPDNERFYQERGGWGLALFGPAQGTIENRVFDAAARADHPELYAFVNQRRQLLFGRVELSQPDAGRLAAAALAREVERYPFLSAVFLTPAPGPLAWSEAAEAARWDPTGALTNDANGMGPGDRPDRVAGFVADVGARLQKLGRAQGIAWEGAADRPPLIQKLPDTVLVFLPPCDTATLNANLERWRAAGGQLIWRVATSCWPAGPQGDAASAGLSPSAPSPSPGDLAEQARLLRKAGAMGLWIDVGGGWALDGPMPWLAARLAWEPALDAEAAGREYFGRVYGDAAGAARTVFDALRPARGPAGPPPLSADGGPWGRIADELTTAARLAEGGPHRQRIDDLNDALRLVREWEALCRTWGRFRADDSAANQQLVEAAVSSMTAALIAADARGLAPAGALIGRMGAEIQQPLNAAARFLENRRVTLASTRAERLPASGWRARVDPARAGFGARWFDSAAGELATSPAGTGGWRAVELERPLMAQGVLPTPMLWYACQWTPAAAPADGRAQLFLEGVSGQAIVYLNGRELARSDEPAPLSGERWLSAPLPEPPAPGTTQTLVLQLFDPNAQASLFRPVWVVQGE